MSGDIVDTNNIQEDELSEEVQAILTDIEWLLDDEMRLAQ